MSPGTSSPTRRARTYMTPEQASGQHDIAEYGAHVNFWQWGIEARQVSGDLERGQSGAVSAIVELHGLTKRFGTFTALDGISLAVDVAVSS